jgi:hypothetical protein
MATLEAFKLLQVSETWSIVVEGELREDTKKEVFCGVQQRAPHVSFLLWRPFQR